MPSLSQIVVNWNGGPVVGPGASVFWCQTGDEGGTSAGIRTFLQAINDRFPTGLQWTFPSSGDIIDELSGHKTSSWAATAPAPLSASGGGTFVNGVGTRVKWNTIGVVGGRQVVGSTFLVPLVAASYEGSGNILDATISAIQAAAATLVTAVPTIRIYSRKTAAHGGVSFPVLSASTPDRVSWLRSRRT